MLVGTLLLSGAALSAWVVVDAAQVRRLRTVVADTSACMDNDRCERLTRLRRACSSKGPLAEALPDDAAHRRYVDDLKAFQRCRYLAQLGVNIDKTEIKVVSITAPAAEAISFAEIANRWNGDFLWEPASASTDIITRFGDEHDPFLAPSRMSIAARVKQRSYLGKSTGISST